MMDAVSLLLRVQSLQTLTRALTIVPPLILLLGNKQPLRSYINYFVPKMSFINCYSYCRAD